MLPNKFLGKYDWNINGKTGLGIAWTLAAFALPMLVWTVFMLARMQGWAEPTKANPVWAAVWLAISLPCLLIAARCFNWRGWKMALNLVLCLAVCSLLSIPAALLIVFTLADLFKPS